MLQFVALNKFLNKKGYIIIDAMCEKTISFVCINPDSELSFIYLVENDYIPPQYLFLLDRESWFRQNPAYKPCKSCFEQYIVVLKGENKASIKKLDSFI